MARKSDIRRGVHLYGDDGYLGIAQSRVQDGLVPYVLFTGYERVAEYADVTVGDPPPAKALIHRALNCLIGSGERFTSDEVWTMLAIHDNVSSAKHGPLLGQIVQKCRQRGQLRTVSWKVTERSAPKSRAVPVWAPAGRRNMAELSAQEARP